MKQFLGELGIEASNSGVSAGQFAQTPGGDEIESVDPATGDLIARIRTAGPEDYESVVTTLWVLNIGPQRNCWTFPFSEPGRSPERNTQ